ncbi:P-loop containing nucleoside triphosphate hydrolase protein [Piedraia hortae CBS 480.64]|uniref:Mitochondrial GTPase 1 n=1 Tax=Piedraia hortae CBS 480.64 TaxID=1314780 RepID=A0A6A7C1Y1_9PEZI|nr:P-loop containing nucleoside triphosphate hydrolase protein [Piedraia hortae CBS 480.64]
MEAFVPRLAFPVLESLPRSYYLGHHAAGLAKMRSLLGSINLVIECRDSRVPLTSHNPLFEQSLGEREHIIVYTKKDLCPVISPQLPLLRRFHFPSELLCCDHRSPGDVRRVMSHIKRERTGDLAGLRVMVVGMPNVGKSSLLNALRAQGMGRGKAARTGAQPGITRKIGTGVKILDSKDRSETVYLIDTPGVFMPYVPNMEAMLRLALCGCVKDAVIQPLTLADYLLFHMNKHDPKLYGDYASPTNDVAMLLDGVARRAFPLKKGGEPDLNGAAMWIIQRWRNGLLGSFGLDEVSDASWQALVESREAQSFSKSRREWMKRRRQGET